MAGNDPMKRATSAVRLTYDDFLRFPDDGRRHELIDGAHFVAASPNLKHQVILANLHLVMASWLEANPVGRAFLSPFDVMFSPYDIVVPDLLFVTMERMAHVLTPLKLHGAPDLVVEIASSSTRARDETLKHRLYERGGVQEYWIVDPVVDSVIVHRLDGGKFGHAVLRKASGDVLSSPLMPGLAIPLARIFKDT